MYKFFFIFFVFLILDFIYLNFSKNIYEKGIGIEYKNVKFIPALAAWLFIAVAYYFTVEEPLESKYGKAFILAIGMYWVYNLTNYAIFPNYTLEISVQDMIWGTSLLLIVTFIVNNLYDRLNFGNLKTLVTKSE